MTTNGPTIATNIHAGDVGAVAEAVRGILGPPAAPYRTDEAAEVLFRLKRTIEHYATVDPDETDRLRQTVREQADRIRQLQDAVTQPAHADVEHALAVAAAKDQEIADLTVALNGALDAQRALCGQRDGFRNQRDEASDQLADLRSQVNEQREQCPECLIVRTGGNVCDQCWGEDPRTQRLYRELRDTRTARADVETAGQSAGARLARFPQDATEPAPLQHPDVDLYATLDIAGVLRRAATVSMERDALKRRVAELEAERAGR